VAALRESLRSRQCDTLRVSERRNDVAEGPDSTLQLHEISTLLIQEDDLGSLKSVATIAHACVLPDAGSASVQAVVTT
jgi:hypothetical protein